MKSKQMQYRSEGITLVLAAVLGLIGICGIGHIYVGRLARGFVLLFGSVAIGVVSALMSIALFGLPEFIFIALAAYLGFYVWTVFDARSIVKKHNESLDNAGEPEAAEAEPDANEPEGVESEPAEAETTEAEVVEPEPAKPEEVESEADEPEVVEPGEAEAAKSKADKPEVAEPEADAPEAAEPEPAKPDGGEPEARK